MEDRDAIAERSTPIEQRTTTDDGTPPADTRQLDHRAGFLGDFDDAPDAVITTALVRAAEHRGRLVQRVLGDMAGSYLGEVLHARDSAVIRWADRDEPLRVWIRDTSESPRWRKKFARQARAAFRAWETSGIPVDRKSVV